MREGTIIKIPKSEKGIPGGMQVNRKTRALKRKVIKSSSRSLGLVTSTYQSWEIDLLVLFEEELKIFKWFTGTAAIVFPFWGSFVETYMKQT